MPLDAYLRATGASGLLTLSLRNTAKLANAKHLRRDLVADTRHDLRTPLMAVANFIETLRDLTRDR